MSNTVNESKIYLIGSGLSSMAAAYFLIKDAHIIGKNIHILEQDKITGGALDGSIVKDEFIVRGGRMQEKHFVCYWNMLSNIPSATDPSISVTEETFLFNEKFVSNAQSRLLKEDKVIDVSSFGLSFRDQWELLLLNITPESILGNKKISDWFSSSILKPNFG